MFLWITELLGKEVAKRLNQTLHKSTQRADETTKSETAAAQNGCKANLYPHEVYQAVV